jgi:hypothetical protein
MLDLSLETRESADRGLHLIHMHDDFVPIDRVTTILGSRNRQMNENACISLSAGRNMKMKPQRRSKRTSPTYVDTSSSIVDRGGPDRRRPQLLASFKSSVWMEAGAYSAALCAPAAFRGALQNGSYPTPSVPKCLSLENRNSLTDTLPGPPALRDGVVCARHSALFCFAL